MQTDRRSVKSAGEVASRPIAQLESREHSFAAGGPAGGRAAAVVRSARAVVAALARVSALAARSAFARSLCTPQRSIIQFTL